VSVGTNLQSSNFSWSSPSPTPTLDGEIGTSQSNAPLLLRFCSSVQTWHRFVVPSERGGRDFLQTIPLEIRGALLITPCSRSVFRAPQPLRMSSSAPHCRAFRNSYSVRLSCSDGFFLELYRTFCSDICFLPHVGCQYVLVFI